MVEIVPAGARTTSGQLAILSCPPALCPHLEFAVAAVLGVHLSLEWAPQPARPGTVCATLAWRGAPGTAGRVASRLLTLGAVYFDVIELATPGCDPVRYCATPELGLHSASLAANGDIVVAEGVLRRLLADADRDGSGSGLAAALRRVLGADWDEVLDPLRSAGAGGPVTHLRRTG